MNVGWSRTTSRVSNLLAKLSMKYGSPTEEKREGTMRFPESSLPQAKERASPHFSRTGYACSQNSRGESGWSRANRKKAGGGDESVAARG